MDDRSSEQWKNVVFLVLDACRSDFLEEYGPNMSSLAENNLYFRNAVAPSDWSLPSHASLFSGDPPHKHGQCSKEEPFRSVPLVENLNDRGYTTYGVSANPFCNRAFDFDEPFDEFVSTMDRTREEGLQVGDATDSSDPDNAVEAARDYVDVLLQALGHEAPLASLNNLAIAGKNKAIREFDFLSKIPHPDMQKNLYTYSPERNTDAVVKFLKRESKTDTPFFIFSNYMDTHRPYYPSKKYQKRILGEELPFREIKRLNEKIGNPQRFLELANSEGINKDDLEALRSLYAGTVAEVDKHVNRIVRTLEKKGLLEETLLVITSDHGEALGEEDPRGGRRMGHIESVIDHHLTVPLIMANPSLETSTESEYVPLLSLFDILQNQPENATDVRPAFQSESPVTIECPASKEDWLNKFPDIPRDIVSSGIQEHICVSYYNQYKITMSTDGDMWAWCGDEPVNIDDCPEIVKKACSKRIKKLTDMDKPIKQNPRSGIDDQTVKQLNDLGYL